MKNMPKKQVQTGSKKKIKIGSKYLLHSTKLNPVEQEVLHLHIFAGLTAIEIAHRRGTSEKAVYKAFERLRKKGIKIDQITRGSKKQGVVNHRGSILNKKNMYRLHGLQYNLKPYFFHERYKKTRKIGNYAIPLGKWKFMLNNESVDIYLKENCDFLDKDIDGCLYKAQEDFNKIILQAANKFGFEVFKDGKCNIKLVKQHLAYTESDISKALDNNKIKLLDKDGKIWFLIDKSKGLYEHEYIKSESAIDDARAIEPFFEKLRQNPKFIHELLENQAVTQYQLKDIATALKTTITLTQQQQKSINTLVQSMDSLYKTVNLLTKTLNLSIPNENQNEKEIVKAYYIG